MVKHKLVYLVLFAVLFLFAGCSKIKYSVNADKGIISDYVGSSVSVEIFFTASKGNMTNAVLVSKCPNLQLQLSELKGIPSNGSIAVVFLINNSIESSNCIFFNSTEYSSRIDFKVKPKRQASITKLSNEKNIKYDVFSKIDANIKIESSDSEEKLRLVISSETPNLKFRLKENSTVMDINNAVIDFSTGEYQESASPFSFIMLQNPGFPSVNLKPIKYKLYIEVNGVYYIIDEKDLSGIIAKSD